MTTDLFAGVEALSFDCYGTLIDWETGIVQALAPWLTRHGIELERDALLQLYGACESAEEHEHPGRPYPEILRGVVERLGVELSCDVQAEEADAFSQSVPRWPPFPDSADALAYLKQHFQLAILSNIDRASFAGSNARLGVTFDLIVTAEDVGSYKPDLRNFARLFEELAAFGIERTSLLHVAQSLYHDIEPANKLALPCVWVDRRHATGGLGATAPPVGEVQPTARVTSLAALAELHRAST